jgi:hypothetical protein
MGIWAREYPEDAELKGSPVKLLHCEKQSIMGIWAREYPEDAE